MSCLLVGYQSVFAAFLVTSEHGFENKIERITLHGIEQKDQDGKKAKEENTNYTELSWYKMTLISAPW